MAITIAVGITGTPDETDKRAATYVVDAAGLEYNNIAELAAHYETLLGQVVNSAHVNYAKASNKVSYGEIKPLWDVADDATRAAMVTAGGG